MNAKERMSSSNQFDCVFRNVRADRLAVGKVIADQDWKSYTPTLSTGAWGTTTINYWRYKVVGRTLSIRGTVSQTIGGTLGSGIYYLSFPPGCVAPVFHFATGTAVITGSSKSYMGACIIPPGPQTTFGLLFDNPLSATPALEAWSSTSDGQIVLSAGLMSLSVALEVELHSSSAILQ
jgi:hypothetical protein